MYDNHWISLISYNTSWQLVFLNSRSSIASHRSSPALVDFGLSPLITISGLVHRKWTSPWDSCMNFSPTVRPYHAQNYYEFLWYVSIYINVSSLSTLKTNVAPRAGSARSDRSCKRFRQLGVVHYLGLHKLWIPKFSWKRRCSRISWNVMENYEVHFLCTFGFGACVVEMLRSAGLRGWIFLLQHQSRLHQCLEGMHCFSFRTC